MKIFSRELGMLAFLLLLPIAANSQTVAVKSNLIGWAATTPNLSVETALGIKTTLDIQGRYNPFRYGSAEGNKKLKHWLVMPEIRMWVYEKFDGHFFGIHPFYGQFNAGGVNLPLGIWRDLRDYRFQGYGTGVGLSYGYQWTLSPHWNLEATFGFGWAYLNYDRYECHRCGEHLGHEHRHYFGPTKIGVSFVYLFKSQKH